MISTYKGLNGEAVRLSIDQEEHKVDKLKGAELLWSLGIAENRIDSGQI
jgi:hypothetical protein